MTAPARVRFAPSPTGRFHLGSARTALYNYLLARQTGGSFILRIEDTDHKRFDPQAEPEIYDAMRWLGLDWDEGPDVGGAYEPYRQSERTELYSGYAQKLLDGGHAYRCFCSPERLNQVRQQQQRAKEPPRYDGLCRRLTAEESIARAEAGESFVVRFKVPRQGQTTGSDLLRGDITVDNSSIDDYVLVKSNGMPVYHLAVVIDDHEMQISHVFRGSEWLPTFPLHVRLYEAFGWEQPEWVHLSVFLNPSGKGKLSKRHGGQGSAHAVFVTDLRQMGYLPEAVNNWIALMGWSFDDKAEHFPMPELIDAFSIERLKPSPAAVNYSKLDHFNGVYIRSLALDDLTARLMPYFQRADLAPDEAKLKAVAAIVQERIRTLDEAVDMAGFFFRDEIAVEMGDLVGKKMTPAESAAALSAAHDAIEAAGEFEVEPLEARLRQLAEELGLSAGQLFGLLRIAVSGQSVSPPLIETMIILGRPLVLARVQQAADLARKNAG